MEESQQTIRKLVAFTALVLVLAGVPHFLLDRKAAIVPRPQQSYEYLLPAAIGKFHVVNRWRNVKESPVIEQGATYQDASGAQTAQFDIMIHDSRDHNGLLCYITRGMPLRGRRTEQVQAVDSTANFDVGFIGDQSLNGAGRSTLFIASTECAHGGCRQAPLPQQSSTGPHIVWLPSAKAQRIRADAASFVPLSVTFQSFGNNGETQDQEQALLQFRELISNFKLAPLRELSRR
jgi:hypothetical protein